MIRKIITALVLQPSLFNSLPPFPTVSAQSFAVPQVDIVLRCPGEVSLVPCN